MSFQGVWCACCRPSELRVSSALASLSRGVGVRGTALLVQVKFLQEQAKADEKKYLDFYKEFGQFIKEGVYTDFNNKAETAKLLRFESTNGTEKELVSLDDYISRMVPEQQDKIYWLLAPSRQTALDSAYMEAFKAKKIEVCVCLQVTVQDEFDVVTISHPNRCCCYTPQWTSS